MPTGAVNSKQPRPPSGINAGLRVRDRRDEWMDDPDIDPDLLAWATRDLSRMGTLAGTAGRLAAGVRRVVALRGGKNGKRARPAEAAPATAASRTLTIADLGCGDGGVTIAVARRLAPWAASRGMSLRMIGFDQCAASIATAKARTEGQWAGRADRPIGDAAEAEPASREVVRDASREGSRNAFREASRNASRKAFDETSDEAMAENDLCAFRVHRFGTDPFPSSIDVAISTLFLHHLTDASVLPLFCELAGAVRQGVVFDDLRRGRDAWAGTWLATRVLSRCPVVHRDGPDSVRGAFSAAELRALASQAGMAKATVRRHWPWRLQLEWARGARP
ncbi:MAG: hypothetical protein AB8G96_02740 [Phycisphaerales bacterium]